MYYLTACRMPRYGEFPEFVTFKSADIQAAFRDYEAWTFETDYSKYNAPMIHDIVWC